MQYFRDLSLKRKQAIVMLVVATVALVLLAGGVLVQESQLFRNALHDQLRTQAGIIGNVSTAALEFDDPKAAREILSSLEADDQIMAAGLYGMDGALVARFQRPAAPDIILPAKLTGEGDRSTHRSIKVWRPIHSGGERIGTIYLESNLSLLATHRRELAITSLGVFLVSLGVAVGLASFLMRFVHGPIMHLLGVAQTVAADKDFSLRATKKGNDELGGLVDGFNEMLDQIQKRDAELQAARDDLEVRVAERTRDLRHEVAERERASLELAEVHERLLKASRQAGMAEVATGVLHNVGNALNSVNVASTVVSDRLQRLKAPTLARTAELLRGQSGNLGQFFMEDPRACRVPDMLDHLARHFTEEQAGLLEELLGLQKNVDHIKDIVSMQQSYARLSGVTEKIHPRELLEDTLRIHADSAARHTIDLRQEVETVPSIIVDKHQALQILVNLVSNAKHACDESSREDKRITIRLAPSDRGIFFSVADNGVGISEENLLRIFNHGFTTRKSGHGFGLHQSAVAVRQMGGTLQARSDGPHCGATFTLDLPLEPITRTAAAAQHPPEDAGLAASS